MRESPTHSALLWLFLAAIPVLAPASAVAQYPEIIWWHDLDAPSFGSAAVGDIDGDNKLEIVFGTYFNDERIYALNAESGDTLWTYNTGGCNDASPVIYDVDLDGELEVIVPASSPSMVYCFNGSTGGVEWSVSTSPNHIDSPPAIADVDNDSLPEIVFGTFYGYIYCLNGENGSQCWRTNLGTDSYIQSGPNILDVDDDGQLDIVVAQWAGDQRVYALRGDDHSEVWHSDLPTDYMYHSGSFADIDEDGKPEIAIGCYDVQVYLLNAENGSLEWQYSTSSYVGAPTSVADLDNDGHLEVVLVSYNRLIVVSHEGEYLWSYNTGGSIFRGAAIADVDGDDTLDIVFGCDDGILRALRGSNGTVVWTYNLENHYGNTFEMDHAPVIADFDDDGLLDVFIVGGYGTSSPSSANHGRAYALRAGVGTGPGWPMFRHDIRHSACFSAPEYLCGDINGDGMTSTVSDIVALIRYLLGYYMLPTPESIVDLDQCGSVNVADLARYIEYFSAGGPGDLCRPASPCIRESGGNSVSLECPVMVPYSADSFAVPILIDNDTSLVALSLGFHYDADQIEFLKLDTTGTVLPGGWHIISSFPGDSGFVWTPADSNVVLVTAYRDLSIQNSYLSAQTGGLLASLWFEVAPDISVESVDFDSLFVEPAGEFIFAPLVGGCIQPEYYDCGSSDVLIQTFICGDADGNGIVNVSDAVHLITYIFGGGVPPDPMAAGDVDCNGMVNVSDIVRLLSYIFGSGPAPCDPSGDGVPDC